jgi:CDP-diacylglycerol--serine O-phosphatidyltransferase
VVVAAFALGIALVSSYPPGVLFGLFLCYALSGYVMAIWLWARRQRNRGPGNSAS